jgi:hypothetical protein
MAMDRTITTISKQAGDANLGQTLIRMARLAAAAHMHDGVTPMAGIEHVDSTQAIAQAQGRDARRQRHGMEANR